MANRAPQNETPAKHNLLRLAEREAASKLLRKTLIASGFSSTEAARRLRMVGPSGELQTQLITLRLNNLGLREWYETARADYKRTRQKVA